MNKCHPRQGRLLHYGVCVFVCVCERERQRGRERERLREERGGMFELWDTKPNIMSAESTGVIYCNPCGCHRFSDNSLCILCQQRLPGCLYLLVNAHRTHRWNTALSQGKAGWVCACLLLRAFKVAWRPRRQHRGRPEVWRLLYH